MIAGCGLHCLECPVYIATKNNDAKLREETADKWSAYFDNPLIPDELYCDGCKTENGKLFGWCNRCPVRICVIEHGMQSCAECQDYPCEEIKKIHEINPKAKQEIEYRIKKIR